MDPRLQHASVRAHTGGAPPLPERGHGISVKVSSHPGHGISVKILIPPGHGISVKVSSHPGHGISVKVSSHPACGYLLTRWGAVASVAVILAAVLIYIIHEYFHRRSNRYIDMETALTKKGQLSGSREYSLEEDGCRISLEDTGFIKVSLKGSRAP